MSLHCDSVRLALLHQQDNVPCFVATWVFSEGLSAGTQQQRNHRCRLYLDLQQTAASFGSNASELL